MKLNTAFAIGMVAITAVTSLSTITNVNNATSQYEAAVSGSMQPLADSESCKCPYDVYYIGGTTSSYGDTFNVWLKENMGSGISYFPLNNTNKNWFGATGDVTKETIDGIRAAVKASRNLDHKVLLVAHSLGASIATNIAAEFGGCVDVLPIDPPLWSSFGSALNSLFVRLMSAIARNDAAAIQSAQDAIKNNPDYINWTNGAPGSLSDEYHTPFGKTDPGSIVALERLKEAIDSKINSCKPNATDLCANIDGAQSTLPTKDGRKYFTELDKNRQFCTWLNTEQTDTAYCPGVKKTSDSKGRDTTPRITATVPAGKFNSAKSQEYADTLAKRELRTLLNSATWGKDAKGYSKCGWYNSDQTSYCSVADQAAGNVKASYTVEAKTKFSGVSKDDANKIAKDAADAMVKADASKRCTGTFHNTDQTAFCTPADATAKNYKRSYTIEANTKAFDSNISVADANAGAMAAAVRQISSDTSICGKLYQNTDQRYIATCVKDGPTGTTGSDSSYTIEAKTRAYNSTVSQSESDQKALAAAKTRAIEGLKCSVPTVVYQNTDQSYTATCVKDGPANSTGSNSTYVIEAKTMAYNSSVSIADANTKALAAAKSTAISYLICKANTVYQNTDQTYIATCTKDGPANTTGTNQTGVIEAKTVAYNSSVSVTDANTKALAAAKAKAVALLKCTAATPTGTVGTGHFAFGCGDDTNHPAFNINFGTTAVPFPAGGDPNGLSSVNITNLPTGYEMRIMPAGPVIPAGTTGCVTFYNYNDLGTSIQVVKTP